MNDNEIRQARIKASARNPSSILRVSFDYLEDVLGGKNLDSPKGPLTFLMESNATNTAAAISVYETLGRRHHKQLAVSASDIYNHMSDRDLYNIFYQPAIGEIVLLIDHDDLFNNLRTESSVDESSGVVKYKTTIPKDTVIEFGDTKLGLYHPVEIEVNYTSSSNLNNTYKGGKVTAKHVITSGENPFSPVTNAELEVNKTKMNDVKFVAIKLPVAQFETEIKTFTIDKNVKFRKDFGYSDNFMGVRFYVDTGSKWLEVNSTQGFINYDIEKFTIRYELLEDKTIQIDLPDIYNKGNYRALRVDLLTTKGEITVDLEEVAIGDFQIKFTNLDSYDDRSSSLAIERVTNKAILGMGLLTGGAKPKGFEDVRSRVINRYDATIPPLRSSDLFIRMGDLGFNLIKQLDGITDKLYLATKDMPSRTDAEDVKVNVKSSVEITIINPSSEEIDYALIRNGVRTTLNSDALFETINGTTTVLTSSEVDEINSNPLLLNNRNVSYSPFHYIFDSSTSSTEVRVYSLDEPKMLARSFIDINKNDDVPVSISTLGVEMSLVGNNYQIKVKPSATSVQIGSDVPYVTCGLLKLDKNGNIIASKIVKANIDTETFDFEIETDLDIDRDNKLYTRWGIKNVPMDLTDELVIVYGVEVEYFDNVTNLTSNSRLPNEYITVNNESVTLRFGIPLDSLYKPFRVIRDTEVVYDYYTEDEQAVYTKDVYEMDGNVRKVYLVEEDGVVTSAEFNKLHSVGDLVADNLGNPVYTHLVGHQKFHPDGSPVILDEGINDRYQVGLLLIDGIYKYANADAINEYRDGVSTSLISFIDVVGEVSSGLDEFSVMEFKPRGSIGNILVRLGDDITASLSSDIQIGIVVHMTSKGFADSALLNHLRTKIKAVVATHVNSSVISSSAIAADIKKDASEDMTNVHVDGFGDDRTIRYMSIIDESDSFNLKEVLSELNNGKFDITESITIKFVEDA